MKQRLKNLQNNPQFQEKLQQMKPRRSIGGFIGVILFFFVPEVVNYLWSNEINLWIASRAQETHNTTLASLMEWSSTALFDGQISWLNLSIGLLFLIWLFRK